VQHGLRQSSGEHLKRDQHADGEFPACHHHPGTEAQDDERQQLLHRVSGDVALGELPSVETGLQVGGGNRKTPPSCGSICSDLTVSMPDGYSVKTPGYAHKKKPLLIAGAKRRPAKPGRDQQYGL
jgi:hypothetical protein